MRNLWLFFVCVMINSVSFSQSQNYFKSSSPEQQELSSEVFADAIQKLKSDGTNVHSWIVIKNDHLVVDAAFYPFNNNYVHDLASVTKSITALLVGIAIDKQFIQHEYIPIVNYFPEFKSKNDTLLKVTIKDLLNMSSGFDCGMKPGEKELYDMRNTDDWAAFMLSLPFANLPGESFSYCSGNFYLLAEILQRATNMTCQQFAEKYLFKPLDFGRTYWPKNKKAVNYGWGDLHISVYDFAKIGILILDEGRWNGKQVISKQWILKMQPAHQVKGTESYGYGWWFDSSNPGQIQAMGRGGQRIFIFTDSRMVVATFGGGGYDSGYLDDPAFKALKEYQKGNKDNNALQQQIIKAGLPDTNLLVNTELPKEYLNKTFMFDENELGIKRLRFTRNRMNYSLSIHFIDGTSETHPLTMDGKINVSKERIFGLPMALKANWVDDVLYMEYNRLTRIEKFEVVIMLKSDNTVEMKLTEASKRINQTINGKAL